MKRLLALFLLLSTWAHAATYTVGPSATYANWAALVAAHGTLQPDDIVEYQASSPGGSATINDHIVIWTHGNGTSGHPIIIRGRSGDTITLDGQQTANNGFLAAGNAYITLDNLGFINTVPNSSPNGVVSFDGQNTGNGCIIQNCRININYVGNGSGGAQDNRGINVIRTDGPLIYNNTITTDNAPWHPGDSDGMIVGASNAIVRGNTITIRNTDATPIGHNDIIQTQDCANLLIEQNYCDRTGCVGGQGQGIFTEYYNYSDSSPTNYGTCTVRNNVERGPAGTYLNIHSIRGSGALTKAPVVAYYGYNNTIDCTVFSGGGVYPLRFASTQIVANAPVVWENNIIINENTQGTLGVFAADYTGTITSDYNHFYQAGANSSTVLFEQGTWAQHQAAGLDTHSQITYAVPTDMANVATGDYRLLTGSANIAAGLNLFSSFTTYRNGTSRANAAFDLGSEVTVPGPTLSSSTIAANGTAVADVFSASCTTGAGGYATGDSKITIAGLNYNLVYSSGSGSTTYNFTVAKVYQGAVVTTSYTQPGNGIEATSGGVDVATFSSQPVFNNSTQPIPAPTGPSATATGSSTIDVGWSDGSAGVTSFIIYRSLTNGSFVQVGTAAAGVTVYHDTGLAASTQYYYVVASTAQGLTSAQTSSVNATTSGSGAPSTGGTLGKVVLLGKVTFQ